MGKRIRPEITMSDVNAYRRIYMAALTVQKDGKGCYFMTSELVDKQMSAISIEAVKDAIEFGKDPLEEANKDALIYRKFTTDEVRKFKSDFKDFLTNRLEWLGKLTQAKVDEYMKPCTTKHVLEELRCGNTGVQFVKDLYLTHLGWTGLED